MARLTTAGVLIVALCALLGPSVVGCGEEAPKAAPAPPAVTVAQPVVRDVLDFDEYTGQLKAVEEVEVRARVHGYLDSVAFKDGDEVKKGQLLFQIDPRPFEAQLKAAEGQLGVVKARCVKAQADVTRYKDLVPKGAATAQDLDHAMGELGEATAGIQAAEAQVQQARLDLEYARITAPIDGVASQANLTVGNLIGSTGGEQLLTTIVKVDPIHVCFDVDQRAIQEYRRQAQKRRAGAPDPKTVREMNIAFQFGLAGEQGFPHEGVLDFIDNQINAATGTILVRGEVANDARLFRAGYFARVRVAPGEKYPAVLVDDRAIGTQQGQKYVLVVDEKNAVVFRPVQTGPLQSDGLRVVRAGLKADERVVVNGLQRARPGSTVKPEPGEMLPASAAQAAAAPTTVAATQPVSSGH